MSDQPVELDDLLAWTGDAEPEDLLGRFDDNGDDE